MSVENGKENGNDQTWGGEEKREKTEKTEKTEIVIGRIRTGIPLALQTKYGTPAP